MEPCPRAAVHPCDTEQPRGSLARISMRLSRIVIRRFKSIDQLEILIPEKDDRRQGSADFVSIVGENNVGKSTILDAIRMACPGSPKPTNEDFPSLDQAKGPIEVEFEFNRLTEKDKEAQAIRAHVFEEDGVEKYRVKKVWSGAGAPEHWAYNPNKKQVRFRDGLDIKTKRDLGTLGDEGKKILQALENEKDPNARTTRLTRESILDAARRLGSPLVEEFESEPWFPHPGGNPSNLDTVLPKVVYVPALRETRETTDVSEKQSPIRKIVETLFEQQLSKHEKVVMFRRAAAELEQLFDVEGKHTIVANIEAKITAKLRELIDIRADLRFEAPDVTADLATQTTLRILQGDVSTKPEHQGHGAQRSIVLALLQLYAEQLQEGESSQRARTLFLIEEPEIYMHPEMCRRMRDALLKIAQSGVAQIICTTHSPVFLDLADRHDGIVIVRKNGAGPSTTQRIEDVFEQTRDDSEQRDRLRMILNFDPMANEVFFSDGVCLVEGDCEIAAVDAIARKLCELGEVDWPAYLAARRSVAIINSRGKWTIVAFQRVLKAFGIRYRVVHDEDTAVEAQRANEPIRLLLTAGDYRRMHSPNFDKQMFNADWTRDKPWKATTTIRDAATIDPKLVEFFEFVLDRKVAQLRNADGTTGSTDFLISPVSRIPRRNLRDDLEKVKPSDNFFQEARKIERIFKIAAGPSAVPDAAASIQAFRGSDPSQANFGRVTGDSMADTLVDGDVIVFQRLDNIFLDPVNEDTGKMTKSSFCNLIVHDGIYILAINDDIDQRAYTMKRVRVHELVEGGWICQIHADNPEAAWGERGLKEIRKTDRVHFAAKFVALVEQAETPETLEREVVPVAEA